MAAETREGRRDSAIEDSAVQMKRRMVDGVEDGAELESGQGGRVRSPHEVDEVGATDCREGYVEGQLRDMWLELQAAHVFRGARITVCGSRRSDDKVAGISWELRSGDGAVKPSSSQPPRLTRGAVRCRVNWRWHVMDDYLHPPVKHRERYELTCNTVGSRQ